MSTPTIIERRAFPRIPVAGIFCALAAWFVGLAVLALVVDPTTVVVFGAGRVPVQAVAASHGMLLSAGHGFVTARSNEPGYVRRLYAHGAWFVWPIPRAGCAG